MERWFLSGDGVDDDTRPSMDLPRLDAADGDDDADRATMVCGLSTTGEFDERSLGDLPSERLIGDAAHCIEHCEARLCEGRDLTDAEAAMWDAAQQRVVQCLLTHGRRQRRVMGNGLGTPEMLCLCLGYLERDALPDTGEADVRGIISRGHDVLRLWNEQGRRSTLREFVREVGHVAHGLRAAAVLLGRSLLRVHPGMTATDRPMADMTVIAIGLDADQEFDNRAVDLRVPIVGAAKADTAAAAARREKHDFDQELLCSVIRDIPIEPTEPTELLRLATRLTFVDECLRATLPLDCFASQRRWWHGPARATVRAELDHLQQHVGMLLHRYLDESMARTVSELMRFQLLSIGAVDHMARFSDMPLHALNGASSLRFDHMRRLADLSLCQRLVTLPREKLWDAADLPLEFHEALPNIVDRRHWLQELRAFWLLVVLNMELESSFDVSLLQDYVILPQDWGRRSSWCTQTRRWGHRRRPLMVCVAGAWHIYHAGEALLCTGMEDAIVLWCKIMQREFQGVTERRVCIDVLLRMWHSPDDATDVGGTHLFR